jgi:hypothetical protein
MAAEESAASSKGKCPACKLENVKLLSMGGLMVCEKCSQKRFSSKVRKSIEDAYERQQEQRRRDAWAKRVEIAKRAIQVYQDGKHLEALRLFRDYIAILEFRFSTGPGGLNAHFFDKKKDAGEILLIAGIYWDMAKIYDQSKGKQAEVRSCLNKFIEFSIDNPHVLLASEAIRKYLNTGKCRHPEDFKRAHATARSNLAKCFIATAVFGPTSPEVAVLRQFRDETLLNFKIGQLFTKAYYKVSPPIAHALVRNPKAGAVTAHALRPLTKLIAKLQK